MLNIKSLPKLGTHNGIGPIYKIVHSVHRNVNGFEKWFIIEGELTANDDVIFYGLNSDNPKKLSYFHLSDLSEFLYSGNGARFECDQYTTPVRLFNLLQKYKVEFNDIQEGDMK